jgi:hypothetical protein
MRTETLPQPTIAAAPPDAFPSVAEVDRIVGMSDLVLRNLLITQSYHELSLSLARMLGPSSNWCTFAKWASKQAGVTIRREDLARVLELELKTAPGLVQAFGEVVEAVLRFGSRLDPLGIRIAGEWVLLGTATLERASEAVARGNRKVFEEIGREISRFLAEFADEDTFDGAEIARFVEALRPGDPPEGQGYLRRAITHLYEAWFLADPKARAERIFLASLEIGFHEQTRLQPELEDALESAIPSREELRRHLLHALFPGAGVLLRLRLRLPRVLRRTGPLDAALDRLCEEFRELLRRTITEALMRIDMAGETVKLGRDLAKRHPESLRSIADPELKALLARIDPTSDSLAGSAAGDWADFPDRMHFLTDLFRCYHDEPALAQPPFTPEQVAALKAGVRPSGRL